MATTQGDRVGEERRAWRRAVAIVVLSGLVGLVFLAGASFSTESCVTPRCRSDVGRAMYLGTLIGGGAILASIVAARVLRRPLVLYLALPGFLIAAALTSSAIDAAVGRSRTTTQAEPTPAAPATTAPMSQGSYNVVAILTFEQGGRDTLMDTLNAVAGMQSVDMVAIEGDQAGSLVLVVDVTVAYSTAENQTDSAWELTEALSAWWVTGGLWWSAGQGEGLEWPDFRLVVSGTEWYCSNATMRGLADHRMSRAQWEAECRT